MLKGVILCVSAVGRVMRFLKKICEKGRGVTKRLEFWYLRPWAYTKVEVSQRPSDYSADDPRQVLWGELASLLLRVCYYS